MVDEPLKYYQEAKTGFLLLTNPPENKINLNFFNCLKQILNDKINRLQLDGLIISAEGRHFSSGADIEELKLLAKTRGKEEIKKLLIENSKIFSTFEKMPWPVISVINGCCIGAGFELALACHYRICSPNAIMGLPETTFGIMPGCGGNIRLSKIAGRGIAARLIITGSLFQAEEALELGIVDEISNKKELIDSAKRLINKKPAITNKK